MTTWLIGLAAKATLLLLSLAVGGAAVRRSPAATRHFVWLSGLAALLVLPLLVAVTPVWSPGWAAELLPEYLLTDAPNAVAKAAPRESFAFVGSADMALLEPVAEGPAAIIVGSQAAGADEGPRLAKRSFGGALSSSMPFWLAFVWVGGVFTMLCRLAVGFGRRARLTRRAAVVEEGPMVNAGEIAARTLSLRRRVRLLLGDTAVVPMTWGVVRPVLFLPAAAKDWSERRLNTVLLHELAHVKRHDSLSRSLAQLACSVFWFHPLAWLSAGRMLREQERACDDVVILAGADPHHYAETLVAIAREFRSPRPSVVGALAFARRSNLEHRVLSILDPLERRKKLSLSRKVVMLILFAGLALPLAALHPTASAQQPDARPHAEQKSKPQPAQKNDPQTAQKSKPRPRSVIVKRADGSTVQVGVVVPRADAPAPQVGVVVPRADAAPQVGVVVPRADAAPQVGVVVSRADAAPQVGVVVPRADAAPQVGVAGPRADASSPQVAVGIPRADAAAPQVGVAVRRADSAAPQVGVAVRRAEAAAPRAAVGVPRGSGSSAGIGGAAPRPPAPQTGAVWTQRRTSRIQLEAEGAIRIAATVAEVELEDGGWLALTEGDRRLEIRSSAGDLEFDYSVDGDASDFDDEAREWANEILGHVAEMGTLRGNIFISTSRGEVSGELTSVVLEPLEVSIAQLELVEEPLVVSVESLELAEESLKLALEELELTQEPLSVTIDSLESMPESLVLSVEALESIGEHLAVTIEPALADVTLQLALEELELAREPLSVTIDVLETMPGSLVLSVEPLEVAMESLALSMEPLELALEMPLIEGIGTGRFDRVFSWSEDGSRFVAMWRGPVELGESVDELDVGVGGDLVIDEQSADGVHRRLHVSTDESGEPAFEWFIDGETAAFDATARVWLQPILDWLNENAGW